MRHGLNEFLPAVDYVTMPLRKHLLFIALLLPQYVFVAMIVYDDTPDILRSLAGKGGFGTCIYIPFSYILFGWFDQMVVLAAIIGLTGLRWWSRWLYAPAAAPLLYMSLFDLVFARLGDDYTEHVAVIMIIVTLVFCFVTDSRHFQRSRSASELGLPSQKRARWWLPTRLI